MANNTKKQTYNISGMHCASCALTIENNLNKLKGVKSANVNFATQKATVEYDCDNCDDQQVIQTVKDAGYQALIEAEDEAVDHNQKVREQEIKRERNLFILSLVLSLPVVFLSMVLRDTSNSSKLVQ